MATPAHPACQQRGALRHGFCICDTQCAGEARGAKDCTNMHEVMATDRSYIHKHNCWIGILGTVSLLLVTGNAFAYVPEPHRLQQITVRLDDIRANNPELWRANFSNPEPGPDGIDGPDGTPDGRGAFQFFHGENGEPGAIYASPGGSHAVYGAILASWAAAGYEEGFGFPGSPEQDAGPASLEDGCRPGDRIQWFRRYADYAAFIACYNWERNFTTWIRVAR